MAKQDLVVKLKPQINYQVDKLQGLKLEEIDVM